MGGVVNGLPHCECGQGLPPASRSVRCAVCRQQHRRAKQAQYQAALRQRQRDERSAKRAARGLDADPPRLLRRRSLVPNRDHRGRDVPDPSPPRGLAVLGERLAALEVEIQEARQEIARVLAGGQTPTYS